MSIKTISFQLKLPAEGLFTSQFLDSIKRSEEEKKLYEENLKTALKSILDYMSEARDSMNKELLPLGLACSEIEKWVNGCGFYIQRKNYLGYYRIDFKMQIPSLGLKSEWGNGYWHYDLGKIPNKVRVIDKQRDSFSEFLSDSVIEILIKLQDTLILYYNTLNKR